MIHMLYMSLPWHDSQGIYVNHLILQSTVTTKSDTNSANCYHKIQLHLKCLAHSYFLAARQLHIDCNALLQYLVFYASKTVFCVSLNAFNCIGGERFKYPHIFSLSNILNLFPSSLTPMEHLCQMVIFLLNLN